ncbi:major tail subunit [Mycobacterium phage Soul22]|uniref:Major tail protein n=2 Tax=Avanivirus TaxID=2843352 RepID=Q855U9_9CAUD|nr:major tail protein [Mycobacterium phage Che9d]YP_009963829.1 major tail protein [Mycobacterium phage Soul22]AAN07932.1 major tail protein [Mycobacterium phage Che9d]QLF84236.1 major tail subunit [Mycobacterium phage Soul22]QXG07399.1 minor tail subunit [Mycobacterium phage RitSun]
MADSKNVWAAGRSADDEAFFGAPLGTPLPTDAIAELDAALEPHGWMGDDGFVNNIQRDVTKHKDFAGTTIKTTQDNYEETVAVTCCESNPVVLKTVFGDSNVDVDFTDGHRKITIRHDEAPLPRKSFVVRVVDGVKTRMLVIPEGQVTEIGEVTWLSSELVQYTLTIDCYKPAKGSHPENPAGVNEYIDEPDVLDES